MNPLINNLLKTNFGVVVEVKPSTYRLRFKLNLFEMVINFNLYDNMKVSDIGCYIQNVFMPDSYIPDSVPKTSFRIRYKIDNSKFSIVSYEKAKFYYELNGIYEEISSDDTLDIEWANGVINSGDRIQCLFNLSTLLNNQLDTNQEFITINFAG